MQQPICTSKYLLISCILNQFALIINAYFQIPHEIIQLLLSHYYVLETHQDIGGVPRDKLFFNLWKYARSRQALSDFIQPYFNLQEAKKLLIALPGSTDKTYVMAYRDVPIFVNLYSTDDIINVSFFDNLYGKNKFKFVLEVTRKAIQIDLMHNYIENTSLYKCEFHLNEPVNTKYLPNDNDNGLIVTMGTVMAKCTVLNTKFIRETSILHDVVITESYDISYEPGNIYTISNSLIAIYSSRVSKYILHMYR